MIKKDYIARTNEFFKRSLRDFLDDSFYKMAEMFFSPEPILSYCPNGRYGRDYFTPRAKYSLSDIIKESFSNLFDISFNKSKVTLRRKP